MNERLPDTSDSRLSLPWREVILLREQSVFPARTRRASFLQRSGRSVAINLPIDKQCHSGSLRAVLGSCVRRGAGRRGNGTHRAGVSWFFPSSEQSADGGEDCFDAQPDFRQNPDQQTEEQGEENKEDHRVMDCCPQPGQDRHVFAE